MEIPFGPRPPRSERKSKRKFQTDEIRYRRRPQAGNPMCIADFNELEMETLSNFSKKCASLSSLSSPKKLIRTRNLKDNCGEEAEENNLSKFIKDNSNDAYPPKLKRKKVQPPSFYSSYHEIISKTIYPLPKYNAPVIPVIPTIDTTLPNTFTKRKMKKYLEKNGEKITSYFK